MEKLILKGATIAVFGSTLDMAAHGAVAFAVVYLVGVFAVKKLHAKFYAHTY